MTNSFIISLAAAFLIAPLGEQCFLPAQTGPLPDSSANLEYSLYQTSLLQLETFLLRNIPEDSLFDQLLQDSRDLAAASQWSQARQLLGTLLELYDGYQPGDDQAGDAPGTPLLTAAVINPPPPLAAASGSFFQVETGVDYSLQEFELSFLEDDSTVVDELQNPYFGFTFFQPLAVGNQSLSFNHRFRIDNRFINYTLLGAFQSNGKKQRSRLEFDGNFFHSQTDEESDFLDGRALYSIGNAAVAGNRWNIDARGRYKWHPTPDSLSSNIFSTGLNAFFEHPIGYSSSLYFSLSPSFYREQEPSGYQYLQGRWLGSYRLREGFNRLVDISSELVYNHFKSTIANERHENRYWSLLPRLEAEWPLVRQWGMRALITVERRRYQRADAVNPDYWDVSIEGVQKFYLGDLKSVGVGFFWEKQTHQTDQAEDLEFARQADFTARGPVFTAEIISVGGLLLNLEYRISWRNYPLALDSFLNSYYSDRFVHSVSLFGWIPLTDQWQIQLFANYDNDQDRRDERNDNRSTLLNAGLLYKF